MIVALRRGFGKVLSFCKSLQAVFVFTHQPETRSIIDAILLLIRDCGEIDADEFKNVAIFAQVTLSNSYQVKTLLHCRCYRVLHPFHESLEIMIYTFKYTGLI